MQGDSGETQFTFDGNAAAPAEGISQSSPGTADSGEKSTRTTKSGWQKMTSRHRRASTTVTPRSARDVARSGNARRSHRSPRRTPTGHRTPRAVEDKHGRESSDVSAKRRSTEARGSSEPIAIIEELREQCQTLREKVAQTEMYAASRDQVIKDIEAKFTEYLRGHNQQVFNEINTLNKRLMYSTNEVSEYHAELMLASKEDEGATIRIEELERRGALAEHGARRIHQRGIEIQEEYKDEVHHLQGLLGHTESRLQQMQHDSSLARSVAETLYKEGNEMQRNLESSIVEYRSQSELANFSHTHLEMTSQRQALVVNELTDENQMLSEAIIHSRKQAELYENNMEQITREYRKKINEANNTKLESDLRHRNTEHDTVKRFANYRNTEAEAIAHLRFESSVSSNAREKMEHYEMLYNNERALTNELKTEIEDRNVKLRRSLQEGPMAIGHGSNQHAIQHLETEVKVAQVRAQDLSEEMDECMYTNIRLKDELAEVSRQGSSTPFGSEVAILRTELESERKYKLATGAQQYERSCEYLGELRDRDEKLVMKDAEISRLRKGLIDAEIAIKSQENLNALPFSAGITSSALSPYMMIGKLESEVEAANDESNILRAWIRQLDDELNKESVTAHSNTAAGTGHAHQQPSHPENQRVTELLREVNKKILDGKGVSVDEGAGIPNYRRPDGNDDPDFPGGPPDPNGPPGPPDPPGLPSLRGSQRDSAIDLESTTAFTAEEPPRISRREADKVYVSPWPKHQNLGVWQSDLIKSVCLAANDGDRAAWEAWLQPALRQNPDIDALNDSGGQRFQSIDAKLSIALSNVISQAGDIARHVAIKLRLRTQASNRRSTFVMGREILAMILEHFRTPGQRETAFTMEHIIQSRYLGDANIETFYEKWMEIVSNMMPEDVPQDDWLRDALYKKIRNSNLMMYDIKQYESWLEGDPRRTYQYLTNAIERHIARIREDKHVAAREKYARDFAGGGRPTAPTPTAPAPPDANAKAKAKANAKEKAAPKPKAKSDAAPVLPSPQPKQHAKGKGQGRKGKSKSRSASPRDKKKIPCHFHFIKKSCRKGKDCEYSHDQKVFDASKSGGHGKGGGKTPRGQSPANKTKKIDEPCWHWAKGKCRYGDKCNKRHDAHLFNTAPNTESPSSSKAAPALLHDDSDVDEPPFMIASNVMKKKVKFNPQKDEVYVYEKKDYVKCSRKSQTHSKGHNKLCRTTDEIRKDEQWAYSCRLAQSRGKAMAIIFDEKYDYSDIDEVLIIVGPTLDIMIRMEHDDDDITREVFTENYVQHVDGRYGKRDNVMCITVPVEERDKRFIMDSGSGHDLISAKKIDRMDLPTYDDVVVNFHTANGVTSSTKRSDIKFEAFDEPAQAHILEDTPSVMSMGKRCVDLEYSFIWPSGKAPYMIDPNGDIIEMTVRDYIPYINIDQKKKKGTSSKIAKIINVISDECSTSEGENMMVIDGESGDELEDLTDIVRRSESKSSKKAKVRKAKRKKNRTLPEVAVGGDPDYIEELASHDDEPDDRGDEYAEFDDDEYAPSIGPDDEEGEHDVEIEEIPEGEAREDDDDVIDVDEEDGGVRLGKRGTLKNEARSKLHLLTHRYKNPYCESCVRAKMKHRKTFRGAFQRKLTKFGDLITFDYVDNRRIAEQDYGDDKTIFVIRDRYTGMLQSYPSARKDTDAVIRAVKQFMGRRKIREAYSDDAPQFDKAMKALKIPMDTSLAGKTKHNSLAERTNQFVLVATTTCLLEAGIPPCFWMYAIRCVSHLLNIEPNDDEVSSWCKLHGEEFKGKMIPFGALVYFKPSDARAREQQHKFDPMGIPGVFAGYSLGPGLHWSRKYRVWALCDWTKQNLAYDAEKPIAKLRTPHYTEKVELKEPLEFPCKAEYERINVTIEGLKVKDRLDGNSEMLPPPPPDDDADDDDGGGDDGGQPSSKALPEKSEGEREAERLLGRFDSPTRMGPPGIDKPAHPDLDIPEGGPEHYSEGKAGDGIVYLNDDGEWVKLNARGHPYRVDERGRRRISSTTRPSKYSPEEWRKISPDVRKSIAKAEEKKMEAEVEKKKSDALIKAREEKKKKKEDKKSSKSKPKDGGDDHITGVAKPQDHVRRGKVFQFGKTSSTPIGSGTNTSHETLSSSSDTDVPADDDFLIDWDEWSEVESGRGPKATWHSKHMYDFSQGKVVATATLHDTGPNVLEPSNQNTNFHSFPCMPCIHQHDHHRDNITTNDGGVNINKMFNTAVARPVARKEMMENEEARKAMRKEWLGQHAAGVYDFSVVREYDDVVREAKRNGTEVHMARIHGICVEKNYQLPKGNPSRKFKGRGVLLGNQVKNQFWEAAFFQDLDNSPATFEASRWAEFYGCLPGHGVKLADAIQAYIQAVPTGPPCWVELPEDAWPDDIDFRKFRRPVVRLVKALYGHPDSGTMWEQHCDRKVRELDFVPVGEEWPSMYFHKKLQLLLVIYVDDLKLAGPEENLTKGWEMLRSKLNIEPETDLGLYLGCILSKGSSKLHDGTPVSIMTYDMEGLLKLSVERYLDIVGKDTKLKHVSTPSLPEETKKHKSRAPCPGDPKKKVACPWCSHEFDPDAPEFYKPGTIGKTSPLGSLHEAPWRHMLPACS